MQTHLLGYAIPTSLQSYHCFQNWHAIVGYFRKSQHPKIWPQNPCPPASFYLGFDTPLVGGSGVKKSFSTLKTLTLKIILSPTKKPSHWTRHQGLGERWSQWHRKQCFHVLFIYLVGFALSFNSPGVVLLCFWIRLGGGGGAFADVLFDGPGSSERF